jgi:mannitol-1-/sugar-/sorbitol-6-phosphatase
MDGILISSLGSVDRSWTQWALMRGIDPVEATSYVHGKRAIESLQHFRPDLDGRQELKILEDLEVDDTEGIEVLPGVVELLRSLPPHRWTVVTSATERLAVVRLQAAGLPAPGRFIHGDSVEQGKPHPAPYIAGAALLGFDPKDCVVFEDSTAGVKAGRAAGCTVIATTFAHEAEDLHEASYIIRDARAVRVEDTGTELILHLQGT